MLKDLYVVSNNNKINMEEVSYWKRQITSNLKIGVELESCYSDEINSNSIEDRLKSIFSPTDNVNVFGKCGIKEVKGDGSLINGVEICTVGRRLNFLDLYEQYKYIVNTIMPFHPIMNSRAGLHNHILMSYGNGNSDNYRVNSLEKSFPSIIFKNFLQLLKRYAPELVWITSTVNEGTAITRMNKFCEQDTLYGINMTDSVSSIKSNINSRGYGQRYKFINLMPLKSDGNVDISTFHVELRFPDGSIFPAQIAAQNMLYGALLIKATELSGSGLIRSGDVDENSETIELIDKLRNNTGTNRTSTVPSRLDIERIRNRAIEFIKFIKPSLYHYDKKSAIILNMLAEKPISLRRRDNTDIQINDYFAATINSMYQNDLNDCTEVQNILCLGKMKGALNENEWYTKTAESLHKTVGEVKNQLFRLGIQNEVQWDRELGLFYFK